MKQYLERSVNNWSDESIRLIHTPSQSVKSTFFYLQESGYFQSTFPYYTERQNLNSFLIVYTISGKGYLTYENQDYSLTKGQAFFINCINYHSYKCDKEEQWEILWIHFYGNNVLGYYEEFCKNGFNIITFEDTFLIESNLRRILTINQRRDLHTEVITSNLISNILTDFLISNCREEISYSFMPVYVKAVLKDIEKNFKDKLSLEEFSKSYSISKFYLSREFKKYVGTSINEYIILTRISYSKELLKYSEISVNDIAYECGINYVSHFIELFKKHEHMTPLTYRKEWVGKE